MTRFKVIDGTVSVDKEITALDEFAIGILDMLKRYVDYVIISGYVSIFFGRARATEDIDIFIKELPFEAFTKLYAESVQKGYEWTVDDPQALYHEYLQQQTPINIWRKSFPLLRIEMKIATKRSQRIAFQDRMTVKFKGHEFFMASVESQIAYKRYIAQSDKDIADARHLELVFENLNPAKIEAYRRIFEEEFHGKGNANELR